jgi:hypothetical protein
MTLYELIAQYLKRKSITMNIMEVLSEFFGVVPIRSAIESELPDAPLAVVIDRIGTRTILNRCGLYQADVMITVFIRTAVMKEIEITETLYAMFYQYQTGGRWHWKDFSIEHGEQGLKSGKKPVMIPFEVSFTFFCKP